MKHQASYVNTTTPWLPKRASTSDRPSKKVYAQKHQTLSERSTPTKLHLARLFQSLLPSRDENIANQDHKLIITVLKMKRARKSL